MLRDINLPKVYCLRNQVWLRFCLIFRIIIIWSSTNNVINKNVTWKNSINNNTFLGYLHSRSMVQHLHLGLQDDTHLFQPLRWCDMALSSWALTFPMLGSLQYPKPFLSPSFQAPVALASHWHYTLAWACIDNWPIGIRRIFFTLQLSLGSFLIANHYCSEWKN